ncbi:MAG: hypothetical protein OXU20_16290 [Myxococcales bacterium]|nr:hypothetical protein [Myxococcales bacterium]
MAEKKAGLGHPVAQGSKCVADHASVRCPSLRTALQQFVERLCERSDRFARLWSAADVQPLPSCTKVLHHPDRGRLVYSYATLKPDDAGLGVRFTIYTAAEDGVGS